MWLSNVGEQNPVHGTKLSHKKRQKIVKEGWKLHTKTCNNHTYEVQKDKKRWKQPNIIKYAIDISCKANPLDTCNIATSPSNDSCMIIISIRPFTLSWSWHTRTISSSLHACAHVHLFASFSQTYCILSPFQLVTKALRILYPEERSNVGLDMISETTEEEVCIICKHPKTAQSHQKSYYGRHQQEFHYDIDEKSYLRVTKVFIASLHT